jgi:hypothetical protein
MSAANPNPMEKSMVSVLVVANAGGGVAVAVWSTCLRFSGLSPLYFSGFVVHITTYLPRALFCSGATAPGSPLSSSLPLPLLPIFPPLFPPQQNKGYNATGPPPPRLSTPLFPPLPFVPVPSLPVIFRLPVPLPSSPLSPPPAFFPSLRAAPPHLSPVLVAGVVSPRLPFPSTILTLIPPLLTTSAQVFLVEGVFVHGWWVFFPLPPFFVVGVLFAVVAARLLSALSFLLFVCLAFPSTVFYPSFTAGAVVVGASGRVVS